MSIWWFNLQGLKVNLILIDYSMPGMTGYELLKKIKCEYWFSAGLSLGLGGLTLELLADGFRVPQPISSSVGPSNHQPTSSLPSPNTSTHSQLSRNIPPIVENNNALLLAEILEPRLRQRLRNPPLRFNDYVCNTMRSSLPLINSLLGDQVNG
ncbi:hypothetical protein M9H77_03638 [Catharanthus roseus]|uniref:Uncharacterized protein n=1 Tax=Catharanthus roseus TaxID=4058 RepID=A0ACC0CBZ7_CATRO|nr:hypothetical protein M9H77_03638 [Catharanthus roseus]